LARENNKLYEMDQLQARHIWRWAVHLSLGIVMLEVRLGFQTEVDGPVEAVPGAFDESDIDLLRRFSAFVDRVHETKLLQRGMPAITNIDWKAGEGMRWTCPPYENGELHELLHVLRPLILSKEVTSFERIAGMLGKKFDSEKFRGHLKLQRTIFEDGELKLYMQISLNDQPLLDDSTLKLWLNGEQYHTDEEKAATWKEIEKALTVENTRALVITQLQSKIQALFNLQYIINLIIGKTDAQPVIPPDLAHEAAQGR
jgi:hypothetical protein